MGLESVNFSSTKQNHLIECYGVILLLRRMKWELGYLINNSAKIGLAAFLCCFGGILLWVNGTNIWYVMNSFHMPKFSVSVTGLFLLWLLTYGLCGVVLALILLQSRTCRNNTALTAFSICCGIYLLMLVWYAVFFCTHLTIFAFFVLLITFFLTVILFFRIRYSLMTVKILLVIMTVVELYFIYFNLTFFLAN